MLFYFIFISVLFSCSSLSVFSQTISKQVIGPGGGAFDTGTSKLSYTTGEAVVGAMTSEDGSIQLGNGYYPSLDLSTLNTQSPELKLQVKVYPNPTTETLFIIHPKEQFFEVRITDLSGKQILQVARQRQQPLSLQSLNSGTYLVTITARDSKQTNTYKIIKK